MAKDNYPHIAELTKIQKQVLEVITQQVSTIIALGRAKNPSITDADSEIAAANYYYRFVDGVLQLKLPKWLDWEVADSLHCSHVYPLAQDADVFLPHVINNLKEEIANS